jgi:hypothetical protein
MSRDSEHQVRTRYVSEGVKDLYHYTLLTYRGQHLKYYSITVITLGYVFAILCNALTFLGKVVASVSYCSGLSEAVIASYSYASGS